jgi:hypothetical protein
MPEAWYEEVQPPTPLTQGDLILNCPLIAWKAEPFPLHQKLEPETLRTMADAVQANVVVMTQACDLEQEKVSNVVLCPYHSLAELHPVWETQMRSQSQHPTSKAWKAYCERICNGYVWNLAILNGGNTTTLNTEHCIVDFHEVYTIPRNFLESLLQQRGHPRLRLLPPYREHLSQAFARFFMRVGLPVAVTSAW